MAGLFFTERGCPCLLAASLRELYSPGASSILIPQFGQPKMSPGIAECPSRAWAKLLMAENHCCTAIVIAYWVCDYFLSLKPSWPIMVKFTLPTLSSLPSLHLAYDYVAAGKWKVKLNDPSRQS